MASLLRAAATWGLFPWRGYCSRGTQVGTGIPLEGSLHLPCPAPTRLCVAPAPCDPEQRITGLTLCQLWVLSEMGLGSHNCHKWSWGVSNERFLGYMVLLWGSQTYTHFERMPGRQGHGF